MPLPSGEWEIDANGFTGTLFVAGVDPQGNLSGTVLGNNLLGFWDEVAQKITFLRVINPNDPTTYQIFTGYLFSTPPYGGLAYTLAGAFEAFQGTGGTAQRSVYGWYAQLTVIP